MEIVQVPVLEDNYVYILHSAGKTAVVDPAVAVPVREELALRGWRLDFIFNTHHHPDHIGANRELKSEFKCAVFGAAHDAARIPGLDRPVSPGEEFHFGDETVKVFRADGHTRGHIVYWFSKAQ